MKSKKNTIEVSFTTRESLHMGSGQTQYGYSPALEIIKQDDIPFIPGSAIKGVVRSNFRKLSAFFKEFGFNGSTEREIFGEENWQSRIFFSDAKPENDCVIDEIPGVRINNESRIAEKGGLFTHEIVGPGVKFHSTVLCKNLGKEKLKMILVSLKECENSGFGRRGKLVSVSLQINDDELQKFIEKLPSRERGG